MIQTVFAALILALLPSFALSLCAGRDIRSELSQEHANELAARVANTAFAQGLYWTAKRGGQEFHILGTLHIPDPRLTPILEQTTPALRRATTLFVEGTQEDKIKLQHAIATNPEIAFITEGPTLPDLLPPEFWQKLSRAASARNFPSLAAAKTQPWFLSVMLAIPPCVLADIQDGETGLDERITEIAMKNDIPVRSLEPYDTIFRIMGQDSLEDQIEMLRLGVLPEEDIANGLASLVDAYFEENIVEGLEVARFLARSELDTPRHEIDAAMDAFLFRMLDTRNKAWLPTILEAPEGITFIAVGAGHLPGQAGILNLLQQEGFALERQLLR